MPIDGAPDDDDLPDTSDGETDEAPAPKTDGDEAAALPRLRGRGLRRHLEAGASLREIDLRRAKLRDVDLEKADLRGVDLSGADLRGANLAGADLTDARMDYVDASRADLRGADLSGVWFLDTDLTAADLRGADLSRCVNLAMANLKRVQWDASTEWPPGLDPGSRLARPAL